MVPSDQIRCALAEVDMEVKAAGDLAVQFATTGDPAAADAEAELDRLIELRTFIADAQRIVQS